MTTLLDPPIPDFAPAEVALAPESAPTWNDFHALEARVEQRADRRDGWAVFIYVLAAIALLFGVVGIGLGNRAVDESKKSVPTAAAAPVVAAPATVPALATSPGPVGLSEFKVQLGATTIAAGNVTVNISNTGMMQHELLVFRSDLALANYPMKNGNIDEEGAGITKMSDGDNLNPGTAQSRTIDLTKPGTYLFVCNLPGHFAAGMYSLVTVK